MSPKHTTSKASDANKTRAELLSELEVLRVKISNFRDFATENKRVAEHDRIDAEIRKSNRAYKALAKCIETMIHSENELFLLEKLCQIIVDVGGYKLAWIGFVENDKFRTVRPVVWAGFDESYVENLRIALDDPVTGKGPTAECLKTGKPLSVHDIRSDPRMAPWRDAALARGYLSTLNIPIIYEKQVIGTLVAYHSEANAVNNEELELMFEMGGNLAYGITAMRDRARRIKAEDRLRESEQRFDYALKAAQEGIWDWNMQTDEVYYSPRYKEMLGYSNEEIEPHASAWLRLMHPDDRDRAMSVVNAVMHGEREYKLEFRMRHKDGHYVDILSRGYPIRIGPGGPITRIVGTHMDITELNRMAEELRSSRDELEERVNERTAELQRSYSELHSQIKEREAADKARHESEERFHALADNIPNLAWMANADGWIFWYNRQWFDYTGTTLEEMQGWGWQKVHHPDYVKAVTEEWSQSIKEGKPYDNIFPLRGKDGNYRWFLTRITPIKGEHGKIHHWFGTNTDITEQKQAEEELKAAKSQAELYLDLMGHDINNINQVAMGYWNSPTICYPSMRPEKS